MSYPRVLLISFAAIISFVMFGGWRTAADADRDEKMRWELKGLNRDTFALEEKVNDLDKRVKALEGVTR